MPRYFSAFSNRSIKAIVYTTVSFLAVINVLNISQVSHSAYPNPTGEVYVEHAASGQRINMYERRNGGKVILHPKDDSIDQKLWIEKNPDDSTFSLWVDNTYARLSTQFTPTSDGTQTEVWMSGGKGDPMQTMRAIPREGYPGQYLLEFVVNGRPTGQCLDAYGGAKYVRPITWTCNHGNNNQGFVIISRKPTPDFTLRVYRQDNPFWTSGYAPQSTNPPYTNLGNSKGNCTWYANGRAKQLGRNSARVDKMLGMAYQWGAQASNNGISTSRTPQVNAIAHWDKSSMYPDGHVAVVEQINSDGSILISESSYSPNIGSASDFLHRTRTIPANNPSRFILP